MPERTARRSRPRALSPLMSVSAIVIVVTTAIVAVGTHQLPATVSFVPALLAIVAVFDSLSVLLLVGDYRDRGDARLLVMACAYAWSLVVMAGYGLAFPGAVTVEPSLATTSSVAPYLYVAWHGGFPVLLGAAWLPWPARWTGRLSADARRSVSVAAVSAAVVAGALMVTGVVYFAKELPALIIGLDTSRMTTLTSPVVIPLVVGALIMVALGTRTREGAERWASVAVLVCPTQSWTP